MRSKIFALCFCLILAACFFGTSTIVYAIPSKTDHINTDKTIWWELDGTKDGNSAHNHRSARSFGGWGFIDREPYTATAGVWDDDQVRETGAATFDVGHGFIDRSHSVPQYIFKGTWDANARKMVDEAFIAWSSITSDRVKLITGIAFTQTTEETNAEIILVWQDIPQQGLTYFPTTGPDGTPHPAPGKVAIIFDSNPGDGGWYFSKDPSGCPANKYHFYSVALHEVGHVVGLGDQYEEGDKNEVMYGFALPKGPTGAGIRDTIDNDSLEGARDLYSIPKPTVVCTVPEFPFTLPLINSVAMCSYLLIKAKLSRTKQRFSRSKRREEG